MRINARTYRDEILRVNEFWDSAVVAGRKADEGLRRSGEGAMVPFCRDSAAGENMNPTFVSSFPDVLPAVKFEGNVSTSMAILKS